MSECINEIKSKYSDQAAFRHLSYRHQIGAVQLELTLGNNRTEEFTCSPVQGNRIKQKFQKFLKLVFQFFMFR